MASLDIPPTTWIIFMLLTPKLSSTANLNSLRIYLVQSQNFRSVFNSSGVGFDFHTVIWLWCWSWGSACWLYCFSCLRWLGATLVVVVVGNSFGNSCDDFFPGDCLGDSGGGVWWLWWWCGGDGDCAVFEGIPEFPATTCHTCFTANKVIVLIISFVAIIFLIITLSISCTYDVPPLQWSPLQMSEHLKCVASCVSLVINWGQIKMIKLIGFV